MPGSFAYYSSFLQSKIFVTVNQASVIGEYSAILISRHITILYYCANNILQITYVTSLK